MVEREQRALSRCHGFVAVAEDGRLGIVETPIFPPRSATPDYLIVATSGLGRRPRRPVIAVSRVQGIDEEAHIVHLRGNVRELEHLPEFLPLAGTRDGHRRR